MARAKSNFPEFQFTEEQRAELLKCWQRRAEREQAAEFLDEAELCISSWLPELQRRPTPVKKKIECAERLQKAAQEMVAALGGMPPDVAALLNVMWLRQKYGDDYFRQHSEACLKDRENQVAGLYKVLAHSIAGKPRPHIVSELDKLPPDFLKSIPAIVGMLKPLEVAAMDMTEGIRAEKNWNPKEHEKRLALSLALGYARVYGKPPSAANGSNFRKFAAQLSKILGLHIGADIVAYSCETVSIYPQKQLKT